MLGLLGVLQKGTDIVEYPLAVLDRAPAKHIHRMSVQASNQPRSMYVQSWVLTTLSLHANRMPMTAYLRSGEGVALPSGKGHPAQGWGSACQTRNCLSM